MELYKKYVTEKINADGTLSGLDFHISNDFNFAFDVVDYYGINEPNRRAMVWVADDGSDRVFTFEDIMRGSNQTANYFKSLGIKKGDRVLLVLRRHYEFWLAIVALHKIGAIVIPATDQLKKKDIVYRFEAAGVSAIVCTADGSVLKEAVLAVEEYQGVTAKVVVNGDCIGWSSFSKEAKSFSSDFPRPTGEDATRKNDIMLMYFTSGTTSYPKIAAHDYTYAIGHFVTAKWWHNVDPEGIHFTVAETGWGKAVWGKLYGQWLLGACIFTYDFKRFEQDKVLSMIAKYQITTFCAPPTIYRFMIKADLSNYNLSSLKYATTAGEALNPEVFNKFKQATGLEIMEGFGQTETTVTIANLINSKIKLGSMGIPSPQYKMHLVDFDGNEVENGAEGEICIDISTEMPVGLFQGYFRDKLHTDEAMHDGLYHTGDMAWRDEDGYLFFVGRTDDVIKSSGYRIGPFEIESVLMEHPAVVECAITGVPDPVRGQIVKATIVLDKGHKGTEELKTEIQNYVKNVTAPYKYPRIIEFVEELPKTISGKIKRADIRKQG
ncbi:MAG: AMP-binding protein [Clostridia bacterium]|nr:AMP-binding protein [Clostridia bacterium]